VAYADVFVPMALAIIFQLLKDESAKGKYRLALSKLHSYIEKSGALNVE
jgi:hypothetical protein